MGWRNTREEVTDLQLLPLLKSHNMKMNTQKTSIEQLNKILKDAYTALAEYNAFINGRIYSEYKGDPLLGPLFHAKNSQWKKLHSAIIDALPIGFIGEDGKERIMGSTAAFTSDTLLYYSEKLDAKSCGKGYRLDYIKSFLPFVSKIE